MIFEVDQNKLGENSPCTLGVSHGRISIKKKTLKGLGTLKRAI